tara:strand:+ start:81174 stop:81617 length:444 start_codon:yes stop_codon:yes gene_type:complete
MSGVNKAIIIGRLGADPEVRQISSGNTVATLSVATSETWNDKNGQRQERTEWHRVVVWGKTAEICGKYLSKGRQVYLEGRLQTRSWEDQQGQKRYTTEIVATTVQFLGGNNANSGAGNYNSDSSSNNVEFQDFGPEPSFDADEEIPF